jgi:lycopene beta-cyclase
VSQQDYDYIIAGTGAAGLSLAYRMADDRFANKRILLLDRSSKKENDRTWCFWEKGAGVFEQAVHRTWSSMWFYGPQNERKLALGAYRYKMLRGVDFYEFALAKINQAPHITVEKAEIYDIATHDDKAIVDTSIGSFTAEWVFSSLLSNEEIHEAKKGLFLWQHFKGWEVETNEAVFDANTPVFMDFRVNQPDGSCFVYVLPYDDKRALVEFTVFSADVWSDQQYEQHLRDYLTRFVNCKAYNIVHTEKGRIPMASHRFPKNEGRTVFIGTAGGQTKGSTGYTFQNIQRHSEALINALLVNNTALLPSSWYANRFRFYDNTLLRVLVKNYYPGAPLFERLFVNNPPQRILDFLDEQSTLAAELALMNTVPRRIFARAVIENLISGK